MVNREPQTLANILCIVYQRSSCQLRVVFRSASRRYPVSSVSVVSTFSVRVQTFSLHPMPKHQTQRRAQGLLPVPHGDTSPHAEPQAGVETPSCHGKGNRVVVSRHDCVVSTGLSAGSSRGDRKGQGWKMTSPCCATFFSRMHRLMTLYRSKR